MPRSPLFGIATLGLAAVGVGAAAWWWWTAPPSGLATDLAIAANWAPADAEGVVVVAQPPRFARWLSRHRAVGVLAAAVIPAAFSNAPPLAPIAPSLARTAHGPLVAWWGASSTGLAARVASTDVAGLRHVAALRALGWRQEGAARDLVRIAVFDGALGAEPTPPALPSPPPSGFWSALARVHGRWWYVQLTRGDLMAQSGTPPALPECGEETRIVSCRLASLVGRGALPAAAPLALIVAADGGWGIRIGAATARTPIETVVGALGERRPVPGDASLQRWTSPFGTLFLSAEPEFAVATRAQLLARLPTLSPASEWGCLRGKQIASALTGAAAILDRLPGMPSQRQVTLAADALRQVEACSWQIEPTGGRLALRW